MGLFKDRKKKKKLIKKIKQIAIHIVVWTVIVIASHIESKDDTIVFNFDFLNAAVWSTYVFVFYISYLWLTPKFLFKKRNVLFAIFSIIILNVSIIGLRYCNYVVRMENLGRYKTELEKEIKERRSEVTKEDEKMRTAKFRELGSKMRDLDVINREISRDSNFKFYSFSMRNMTIFYGIMFIFSISIIIRFMERSKKEEERVASLQQEKISSELEYLKQQINPHFLFNALNSIYSLTILNSESSSDAVLKLASILRYMLYETDKDRVQLEDEIEVIENYLGLQQLRLTSKTEVNFTKIGNTEPYRIEPMLLIPILENAFKYGINSSKHTEINILLEVENDNLTFICENKIVKLKVDNKNSGIGIKNIRRRLDLLYEDNYTFKAGAKDDTFIVKLVLPLNETSIS